GFRPHRPVVEGRQLHAFRRSHDHAGRVRRRNMSCMPRMLVALGIATAVCGAATGQRAAPEDNSALVLDSKVPLGNVRRRVDDLAVDRGGGRLFVAELENGSVGIVDVAATKLLRRITGFKEPQGVGYVPSLDTLYVASGGDGSVRIFSG